MELRTLLGAKLAACFPFATMNKVQERVLPPAFQTHDNMVVASPTGSGKTTVMEIALLRHMNMAARNPSTTHGKVLYLAPIKALLHERLEDWEARFGGFGVQFCELSDKNDTSASVAHADVLLSTPEKWDALTRHSKDALNCVSLLMIDEIHNVADASRGASLEALVTRMLHASSLRQAHGNKQSAPISSLRIVALSATCPNVLDFGVWLRCPRNMIFEFGSYYRPVPLKTHVVGINCYGKPFMLDKCMDDQVPRLVKQYSNGRPSLIFCASRKSACALATKLANENTAIMRPSTKQLQNKSLQNVIQRGIGFHHAALSESDKHTIEGLFVEGLLSVLCSTSSLAVGVNLPAHLVIIKSTQMYQGSSSGHQEYTQASIVQMLGRAGRPRFDTSGTAVIMTTSQKQQYYEAMLKNPDTSPLESSLLPVLADFLNCEIALETVSDASQAIEWTTCSFMHVRLHSPLPSMSQKPHPCSKIVTMQAIEHLANSGRLAYEDDLFAFSCTEIGHIQSLQCLKHDSMSAIISAFDEPLSTVKLLDLVASEARVPLRRGEKMLLTRINDTRFRFRLVGANGKPTIQDDVMKTNLLLQASLGHIDVGDDVLVMETQGSLETAERLAHAALDYALARSAGHGSLTCYLLWRSLRLRMWEDAPGCLGLQQLDAVSASDAKRLDVCGVHNLRQLQQASVGTVQNYLGCSTEHAINIYEAAAAISSFRLRLVFHAGNAVGGGPAGSLEVVVEQEPSGRTVHNLTRKRDAYDLFVLCENTLLLLESSIDAPTSFVVHLTDETKAAALSAHLLHASLIGMDVNVEWSHAKTVVKKKVYQSTIPQNFLRDSVATKPVSRCEPTLPPRAQEPASAPMDLSQFKFTTTIPTQDPRKLAAPKLLPSATKAPVPIVHVVPPEPTSRRGKKRRFQAYDHSELSALELEFINDIY